MRGDSAGDDELQRSLQFHTSSLSLDVLLLSALFSRLPPRLRLWSEQNNSLSSSSSSPPSSVSSADSPSGEQKLLSTSLSPDLQAAPVEGERPSHRPGEREGEGGGVKSRGRGSEVKRKSFLLTESHLSFSSNGAAICQSGREGRGQQVSLAPAAAAAVPRGPGAAERWLWGPKQVVGLFTVSACPPTLNPRDEHGLFNRVSAQTRPAAAPIASAQSQPEDARTHFKYSAEVPRIHDADRTCLLFLI